MPLQSPVWDKPTGDAYPHNHDLLLLYFTSGTTGMPKMAAHSWTYPIAQTVTAYYWHNVGDGVHPYGRGRDRLGQGGLG